MLKGVKFTDEHRLKLRLAKLGKGKSLETRKKMSLSHIGNKSNTGRKLTSEHKNNIKKAMSGRKLSVEHRRKLSNLRLGEKSKWWKGGITFENLKIRKSFETILLRDKCYKRDNYSCQKCFTKGGKLNMHHIKSFSKFAELRFDINNVITLCHKCHKLTDNYGGYSKKPVIK